MMKNPNNSGREETKEFSGSRPPHNIFQPSGHTSAEASGTGRRFLSPPASGFTFVELLVAMGIGAMVIVVAVMAYGAIASTGISRGEFSINIGATNSGNFYGREGMWSVSRAPSFAAAVAADSMKDRLLSDIEFASAVVCLPRNKVNAIRSNSFTIPANIDPRNLNTPNDFRVNIIDPSAAVYSTFTSSTNLINGATTNATNLTIYILEAATTPTNWDTPASRAVTVPVRAIYESDLVRITNSAGGPGMFASVRRYEGSELTQYYHVFFADNPRATNSAFKITNSPAAAFFSVGNGNPLYRKATNMPFYFVWWPDPSRQNLASPYLPESSLPNTPRTNYSGNAGRTPYFFVIPEFPSL